MGFLRFMLISVFCFYPEFVFASPSDADVDIQILTGSYESDANAINAAVKVQVEKDWHIYYKEAGDIGISTDFIWKGDVLKSIMHWPVPGHRVDKIGSSELSSNVYEGTVIFPVKLYLKPLEGHESKIDLHVDFSVCKDICIPKSKYIQLSLNDIASMKENIEVMTLIGIWSQK